MSFHHSLTISYVDRVSHLVAGAALGSGQCEQVRWFGGDG
jgi:hypothetical protein